MAKFAPSSNQDDGLDGYSVERYAFDTSRQTER